MTYGSENTANNVVDNWGLVHGFLTAKARGCSPLHVVGDKNDCAFATSDATPSTQFTPAILK